MIKTPISADSHITEPPDCYAPRMPKKYKDKAPVMKNVEGLGDVYVIDGMDRPVPMGLVAAAGKDPKDMSMDGVTFEELHLSGWNPKYRIADQEKDGIGGEIIYPTVGMLLCSHDDAEYKRACFDAYNLWLAEFCAEIPDRAFGLGQTAVSSVDQAIKDFHKIKEMGHVGVMMPGNPCTEFDYDDERFNPLWEASVDLDLPLSFHILTAKGGSDLEGPRGPMINGFLAIMRSCQDVMGMFVFGGVFDRYPNLKLVCAEADAGWVPHYMYRMDHAYEYHRYWMKAPPLQRKPSEYFRDNISLTFQDDHVAFITKDLVNVDRLMWATDFPHSDSTWPRSQEVLESQTTNLTEEERNKICRENVVKLYNLPIEA